MKKVLNFIVKLPANFLILLIKIYQYTLSPFIGRNCRYTPTCSNYGIEAIRKYGAIKGGWRMADNKTSGIVQPMGRLRV